MKRLYEKGLKILKRAVDSVIPGNILREKISFDGKILKIDKNSFDIRKYRKVWILGAGKASFAMGEAILDILKGKFEGGFICGNYDKKINGIFTFRGSHPIPDEKSLNASKGMEKFIKENINKGDLCIFLLSGGASSIICYPDFGLTIEEKSNIHKDLLDSGADIKEINIVRKHFSRFKGGKLSRIIPCDVINLILSDVPGDDIESIGSGPLSKDSSTWIDVKNIFEKYKLAEKVPAKVLEIVELGVRGELDETLKDKPVNVKSFIIGNNLYALEKGKEEAERLGFPSIILTSRDQGRASELSKFYSRILMEILSSDHPCKKPCCILAGGEAQVEVKGKGKGGRNQEFVLWTLIEMKDIKSKFSVMSIDSDGIDGPTDASGAWIDESTIGEARKLGLDPIAYLKENNSYNFFDKIGNLIRLGETSTNVSDIRIFLTADE